MAKLTDTQLVVLSNAASHEGGIATLPNKMNKAAAAKVGSSLVARKVMREVRSKPGMPIWREDADNRSISLMITRAGRKAIGVEDDPISESPLPKTGRSQPASTERADKPSGAAAGSNAPNEGASSPRAGSKQALVIDMLNGKKGATLDALVEATGWLPHTTRAALTGLRKRGFRIERHRGDGGASTTYRIATEA